MREFTYIGKRVPRSDSLPKALGSARYVGDMVLPGMLYGAILRSPHAHARILSIATSQAERLPGVRAVITGNDTLKLKYGLFPRTRDQHLLAVDRVRYMGEEVAGVAATDEDIAHEALSLIKVEYEPLPAVFDAISAMKDGAPQLHEHAAKNIAWHTAVHFGNVNEGFRQSDYVRSESFKSDFISHCQMEPYAALASWDPAGKLDVWMPNMSPFTRRRALSNLLGIPTHLIRVHHCNIGGAFGGRSDVFPAEFVAAILSRKAGRPVRIVYTRQESLANTRMMHAAIFDIKIGIKRDGTIMARDTRVILEGGAYLSSGIMACTSPSTLDEGLYRSPNFKYEGFRIYTNKTPCSMHRNHPMNLGMGTDMVLDMLAEDIGMDPKEIRLRNAIRANETLPSSSVVTSCGLSDSIEKAAEMSGWKQKWGKLPRGKGIGMGSGVCISGFPLGMRLGSSAFVKLNEDGTASVLSGIVDNGQGNESMMVQITADELGVRMEDVVLVNGDTELTPQDPGTYSMTATSVSANAVRLAAQDARQQILDIASGMLEAPSQDLDLRDRKVLVSGSPGKAIPLEDVVRLSFLKGTPILGRGTYMPKPHSVNGWADWGTNKINGQHGPTYTFGTAVAEVEVDEETGKVKVTGFHLATDVGFAINPMAVEGQMESFAVMLLGQMFLEKHDWDEKGKLITGSLAGYKIPTALDAPAITSHIVESHDPDGPYGGKDAGISGTGGVMGAIANAIYDAVGVRIKGLPVTPEDILKALRQGKGKG
ncbi:MAG: molybdopterin-dependent oxidoreductase [Chloroflexi bacterium]|nr:molybdopterin-dependent oxidoreductase [Chloroflexota bacterium]